MGAMDNGAIADDAARKAGIWHSNYNRENYPHFVQHHGCWDIWRDDYGKCAAIPVDPKPGGALPSQFGDLAHVARMNRAKAAA